MVSKTICQIIRNKQIVFEVSSPSTSVSVARFGNSRTPRQVKCYIYSDRSEAASQLPSSLCASDLVTARLCVLQILIVFGMMLTDKLQLTGGTKTLPCYVEYKGARRATKIAVILVFTGLLASVLAVAIYTTCKVQQLEDEINELREYIGFIDKRLNVQLYADDLWDADYEYDDGEMENIDLAHALDDENEEYSDVANKINFTEGIRSKRDLTGTTDGVSVNRDSYAEAKERNMTRGKTLKLYDNIRAVGGDGVHSPIPKFQRGYESPSWNKHESHDGLKHYEQLEGATPAPIMVRRSRVMQTADGAKPTSRLHPKSLETEFVYPEQGSGAFGRRHNQRKNLETLGERHLRRKPLPAIHFSGDTSRYVYGQHENYNGNGHLLHADRKFVDWSANDWVSNLGMDRHFDFEDGELIIKEPGLYFVYAQIYYIDEHDTSGYIVYKNDEPILQCTTMTHSHVPVNKTNTCFTAGAEYFEENDKIIIRDVHSRYSVFQKGKSFFGAIKLGDIKSK